MSASLTILISKGKKAAMAVAGVLAAAAAVLVGWWDEIGAALKAAGLE